MDIIALKILDLFDGIWASGAVIFMFIRLSGKKRKGNRALLIAAAVMLYGIALALDIFALPLVDSILLKVLIIAVNMVMVTGMIFLVNDDPVKKKIFLFLVYLIPTVMGRLLLGQMIISIFGDIDKGLGNYNVHSLFIIYSLTLSIVYSMSIVLFNSRRKIMGVWNLIFLLALFSMLGLTDLLFVLHVAPNEISLVNSLGGSIQLFITASISYSLARFIKINNNIIEYEREQEHMADLRDIDKRYYELVSADVEYVGKFRHDIANYTEQIDYMISHRDEVSDQALGEVVSDLKDKVNNISRLKYCDDPYVNMILVLKDAKCKGLGIPYSAKANVAESPVMEPLDRSSLLSNLIDNAINSAARCKEAGRDASVSVSIGLLGDYIAVRTENDTMLEEEISDLDTLVSVTKEKRRKDRNNEHGYGLVIIRETVGKYGGDIVVNIKNHKCVIVATIKVGEEGVIKNV
ncbi:MAG: GHKL domain-containing protein [Saccharofermentans sp.]|nr:GHKL domain-containing protein [Saccharofermentans sp.]